ncbi:hypothetical protein PQX77_001025 [Marasmius sp. AFHP31]|nr:hypothetical protein PQX77_001025 [Marasmius sp. AFHP31]
MPTVLKWTDSDGLQIIQDVVTRCIPQWPNGLFEYQLKTISKILEGESVILFAGTGGGKAALFTIPLVIHREVQAHPGLYPYIPSRKNPAAIVVTPTKGLSNSICHEAESFGLTALSYCHQTITGYRKKKINLVDLITRCETWSLICVDPEHLNSPEWRHIIKHPTFSRNLILFAVDEAHLVKTWGVDFRPAFELIGAFAQGHLPPGIPVVALSATCAPGPDTAAVCQSLGLLHDQYHLVRRSNERTNMHVLIETAKRTPGLSKYSQILDYLRAGRKTVIHVNTIPVAYEIYEYLWEHVPEGYSPLRRIRMFHSLCTDSYNQETFELMDSDLELQVLIVTVAFTMGINCRHILDSISWNFPSSLDDFWQAKGRAGRSTSVVCRGIAIVPPSLMKAAMDFNTALGDGESPVTVQKARKGKKKRSQLAMEKGKARFLLEEHCYVGFLNQHYQNPDASVLDCNAAGRTNFCGLCSARYNKEYMFDTPSESPQLPWKPSVPSTVKKTSERKSKTKLGKQEKTDMQRWLIDFHLRIRSEYQPQDRYLSNHPAAWFFPDRIIDGILSYFLTIKSQDELSELLRGHSWTYTEGKTEQLYDLLAGFQVSIRQQRKQEKKERARKRAAKDADDMDLEMPSEVSDQQEVAPLDESVPAPSKEAKNPVPSLPAPTTNQIAPAKAKARKPREAQLSAAEYSASFGPQRAKRNRW